MAKYPSLTALKAFEAAARHQSLTIAADELSVSQSAVSKHVQLVESHFGRRLFERKGPKLILTSEGMRFCKELGTAFKMLEAACLNVSRNDVLLRLKAPTSVSIRWLLGAVTDYHKKNSPRLVKLESAWMDIELIDFSKEPYDCAVQYGSGKFPSHWESIKLFSENLIPMRSPAYPYDPRARNEVTLLHASHEKHDWDIWCRLTTEEPRLSIGDEQVFDTMDLALTAASQGFGVTIGDTQLAKADLEAGVLTTISGNPIPSGQGYFLVWPKSSSKEALILRFAKFLTESLSTGSRHIHSQE